MDNSSLDQSLYTKFKLCKINLQSSSKKVSHFLLLMHVYVWNVFRIESLIAVSDKHCLTCLTPSPKHCFLVGCSS